MSDLFNTVVMPSAALFESITKDREIINENQAKADIEMQRRNSIIAEGAESRRLNEGTERLKDLDNMLKDKDNMLKDKETIIVGKDLETARLKNELDYFYLRNITGEREGIYVYTLMLYYLRKRGFGLYLIT